MADYLPPLATFILFNLFAVFLFENRHWWEVREAERRRAGPGAWALSSYGLPDWSHLAGTAFHFGYTLWFGWAHHWLQAAVLFVSSWIFGWGYVLVTSRLLTDRTSILWRPATFAMWAVALLLTWLSST
ncbi:MAG: hypothetical protein D6754_01770 [Alphaproteobacteria bacterium]|nr:MAG: hypothetical protein D6754_01770 [Alphaproteobacteria bacterium]